MAFNFDARGDSSDDDAADIDLSVWKSTVSSKPKPKPPPARVAPLLSVGSNTDTQGSGSPDPLTSAHWSKGTGRSPSGSPSPYRVSFMAINHPVQQQAHQTANKPPTIPFSGPGVPLDEQVDGQDDQSDHAHFGELQVQVSRNEVDLDDYEDFTMGRGNIRRIVRDLQDEEGNVGYEVLFNDFHIEKIQFDDLLEYEDGQEALADFISHPPPETRDPTPPRRHHKSLPDSKMSTSRPNRGVRQQVGFVKTLDFIEGSDADSSQEHDRPHRLRSKRKQDETQYNEEQELHENEDEESDDDELLRPGRTGIRNHRSAGRRLRGRSHSTAASEGDEGDDSDDSDDSNGILHSDLPHAKRRKTTRQRNKRSVNQANKRQPERSTRHRANMQEIEIDDIYRSDSEEHVPVKKTQVTVVREQFKPLPRNDDFRMRHCQYCESCGQDANFAALISCQGCSFAYHKSCLGHRTTREHLVTKIGDGDFVLQCRRCVAFPRKKDSTAPDHGKCQDCRQHGSSCRPFRSRKTPAQEQKERDENDGVDPSYEVPESKINNANNVLFRCVKCFRGFHFQHLPSRSSIMDLDMEVDAEQRFREYKGDWQCKECTEMPAKVSGLIAWKPLDEDSYDPALGLEGLEEDEKVYLVRWDGMSYFRACWMPGSWVWGVTPMVTRKAFAKRNDSRHPKMRTEDAIPEDYLRTDIVLDIRFTSIVDVHTEDIDKARIREVKEALIKYKGLSYEDAVWEAPPGPDDGERWTDFVIAYNDWVAGRYVRQPKPAALKQRLEKARKEDFGDLEKKEQPKIVEGGKLMEYQIQGLNWLYYKWFSQSNAVLADEMGLGKTIQIIAFLGTLVQDHNCYPFVVVVPNATCPNWRREIKRWAPSLRVVAYYGSRESRDLAHRHELYPDGAKDLRCHIVVTSYDAAADESCRKFFRGVPWQGLFVDEGQRLKNDKNLLYSALGAMKAPFKVLLTGTPLQNNARELFNLLHFLDDSFDAAELEKEYEDLNQEKIAKLHESIRPFFLRRTKAQVLTFLPPMAQIILPVSMSLVQKKLYRSILAKNPDLMKAIFSTESGNLKAGERASLSNILMQLRKCLCHPFVYSKGIEDRNVDLASSHRNLVDASSKLKLLEILLPKLQQQGHRVLIFSQFLDMLDMVEDFLDGMQLRFQRLDGSINALTKQTRIDEFNAPNSPLFAFLLSTRAGGVGINLATADTVIILDPDFNPHQDIQALSRAHRIGQQKKVLCFQLVTRASAEERIMQIGRKKLALDHVLIQEMDAEDADQADLASVLRHGAGELFDDNGEQDIVYDAASIDRLIDRSHIEDTRAGEDKSAETQFSFARVWANNQGVLEDASVPEEETSVPDPGTWANILKERERVVAEEAAARAEAFGRGRRARAINVDYTTGDALEGAEDLSPHKRRRRKDNAGSETDTDFQEEESDAEDDASHGEQVDAGELNGLEPSGTKSGSGHKKAESLAFRRAIVPRPIGSPDGGPTHEVGIDAAPSSTTIPNEYIIWINCRACHTYHPVGSCPLKLAGVEHCNLCGIAHFGHARVCPHIQSETQVRLMLEALKDSNEPEHLVSAARRYLRGVKGSLVQTKKMRDQREYAAREGYAAATFPRNMTMDPGSSGW